MKYAPDITLYRISKKIFPHLMVFILLVSFSYGQNDASKYWKVVATEYDYSHVNSSFFKKTKIDSVKNKLDVDLNFLKKHFYLTFRIPCSFIDLKKSGDTIISTANPTDSLHRLIITKIFNNDGYLTEYSNSSCLDCGWEACRYLYHYEKGKLVTFIKNPWNKKECFEISYNEEGDLIQFTKYEMQYQYKYTVDTDGKWHSAKDEEYDNLIIDKTITIEYK